MFLVSDCSSHHAQALPFGIDREINRQFPMAAGAAIARVGDQFEFLQVDDFVRLYRGDQFGFRDIQAATNDTIRTTPRGGATPTKA